MLFGDGLAAAVRQMLPAFADRSLHAGIEGLSVLLAGAGIGATLAALWLARGGVRRAIPSVIIGAFAGFLLATLGFAAAPDLAWATLATVGRGATFEICRTGAVALLQISVPEHLRGRVMSVQFLLQQGAGAMGVLLVGTVAEWWGLRGPLAVGVGLAGLAWCAVRRRRAVLEAAFARPAG